MKEREREIKGKLLFYIKTEEERLTKIREEEARKHEEEEKKKREAAERKVQLDKVAEKQRQREMELEEKERQRREAILALLSKNTDPLPRPTDSVTSSCLVEPVAAAAAAAAAASAPCKYVPLFRSEGATATTLAKQDRQRGNDDRPPQSRQIERELEEKERQRKEAALLSKNTDPLPRPTDYVTSSRAVEPVAAAAAAAASAPVKYASRRSRKCAAAGKYVPRYRREGAAATPPAELDRQRGHDDLLPQSRQKERKLEEKERQRREAALLSKNTDPLPRPTDSITSFPLVEPVAAAAASSAPGKYDSRRARKCAAAGKFVPRFRREGAAPTPPAELDRQRGHDDLLPQSRQIESELEEKERQRKEATLLSKNTDLLRKPTDSVTSFHLVEPVATSVAASAPGKYASRRTRKGAAAGKFVPRFRRDGAAATPPAEQDRQRAPDDCPTQSRQKERKLEEKERQRMEALLSKNTDPLPRPTDSVTRSCLVEPVASAPAASAPRKYVPLFLREGGAAIPPAEQDREHGHDDLPPQSRQKERELEEKERQRREALLSKNADPLPRPTDSITSFPLVEPVAAAAAASAGKYDSRRIRKGAAAGKFVPRYRRQGAAATSPAEQDRQRGHDDLPPQSRQKERELEEKESLRREALLSKNTDPLLRPTDSVTSSCLVEPAAAADASVRHKYVPWFRREGAAAIR